MLRRNPVIRYLVHMPRTAKRLVAVGVDASMCVATVWLAL